MEEIKETKTKKIIKFLLDHIMVISAIIFLCVLLFSSCSTANAEAMNSSDVNTIESYISGQSFYSTISTYMTEIYSKCPYYSLAFDSSTGIGKIAFFPNDYIFTEGIPNNWTLYPSSSYNYWGCNTYSTFSIGQYTNLYCVILIYNTFGQYGLEGRSANSPNVWTVSEPIYEYEYNTSTNTGETISKFYRNSSGNHYNISGYENFNSPFTSNIVTFGNGHVGYYDNNRSYYYEIKIGPEYTNDDRLKIYTINDNAGDKYVVFDIDDFNFSNYSGNDAATQNTLYNNQISVTIDYDGTEQTFILDNTNSDILPAYLIETPYSFFNLGEYTNVKITKVEFSKLIHYMPSEMREDEIENYYISCDYYLKRPESAPEASDIPYNSDVDNTKITQLQIDEKNEIIDYNNGHYSPSGGGGEPLVVPDGYTVKLITVTGTDTLASILNDIYNGRYILDGLSGIYQFTDDVVDFVTGISTTDQFMEFMEDSIKNNNYSLLYDFVVYYWAPDVSLGEPDAMYYYLTNSGKLRTINKTLADIWIESNQVSVNTGSLYDYLKERLDDFENQTLEQLYGSNKLIEKSNEWLQTINNTLSNLSFSDPFDDSDLLDKLDYVISILDDIAGFFSGDSNEGYNKFTKWIEEIEDDGEITPHEWANNIFDYVTGLYHSLSDGTSYYTDDISDYIDYVNQDGNSDPGNYFFAMYDGTYDPHNYYGWTGGLS